jgi:signal transduction histidine kinase
MSPTRWLRRARGSVRLRVTLLAAGAFALVLVAAAVVLVRVLEQALEDDVRAASEAVLQRQATMLVDRGLPAGAETVRGANGEVIRLPPPGVPAPGTGPVVIFARNPDALADVLAAGGEQGPRTDVTFIAGDVPVTDAETLGIQGSVDDYLVSSLRVSGGLVLATAASLEEVRDTIATTRTLFWFVGPILVALVAGLAWLLAGRALRPVHAVTSRVAEIGSHSLHERVPVPASTDEIAELATTMNEMLGRLEASSTTNRRLVSDASHELRTPVTVMRTELEVARRDPSTDWDTTGDVLLGELDRLQGMIDDLLLLARGDERALARDEVDVNDIVHQIASRRRSVAVQVIASGEPASTVGDADALRRALDHLVANAARHARSRVVLGVAVEDGEVGVHVDDDGSGIPAGQRERVVRRFVRSDEGRARDNGGAGLGLAVASDVAAAHGGRLVIDDSPFGGARVSLILPRSQNPEL